MLRKNNKLKFSWSISVNLLEQPALSKDDYGLKNVLKYTVKLTPAKSPANAGKFTRGLHVKRPHTQFTCVTCSLPVKTGKFIRVYGASISGRIQAIFLQPHVNLPE